MRKARRVAYQAGAICVAVLTYVGTAFVCGMTMVPLLGTVPDWPRLMALAVGSTLLGILASWAVTTRLFPSVSGKAVALVFTSLNVAIYVHSWSQSGQPPALVPTVQSTVLICLACGLFMYRPHRIKSTQHR